LSVGEPTPTPTLPSGVIPNNDCPLDDATIKGYVLPFPCTNREADVVVVPIDNPPLALKAESMAPLLSSNRKRLRVDCPCPAWMVSVVDPVDGVSSCILNDWLDSRFLLAEFHLITAFGVRNPLKKTSDESSVSTVALSVLRVNVLLDVPEIDVLPADKLFRLRVSKYPVRK
jgi:hypothetical protein